jgi:hypothetical protein
LTKLVERSMAGMLRRVGREDVRGDGPLDGEPSAFAVELVVASADGDFAEVFGPDDAVPAALPVPVREPDDAAGAGTLPKVRPALGAG